MINASAPKSVDTNTTAQSAFEALRGYNRTIRDDIKSSIESERSEIIAKALKQIEEEIHGKSEQQQEKRREAIKELGKLIYRASRFIEEGEALVRRSAAELPSLDALEKSRIAFEYKIREVSSELKKRLAELSNNRPAALEQFRVEIVSRGEEILTAFKEQATQFLEIEARNRIDEKIQSLRGEFLVAIRRTLERAQAPEWVQTKVLSVCERDFDKLSVGARSNPPEFTVTPAVRDELERRTSVKALRGPIGELYSFPDTVRKNLKKIYHDIVSLYVNTPTSLVVDRGIPLAPGVDAKLSLNEKYEGTVTFKDTGSGCSVLLPIDAITGGAYDRYLLVREFIDAVLTKGSTADVKLKQGEINRLIDWARRVGFDRVKIDVPSLGLDGIPPDIVITCRPSCNQENIKDSLGWILQGRSQIVAKVLNKQGGQFEGLVIESEGDKSTVRLTAKGVDDLWAAPPELELRCPRSAVAPPRALDKSGVSELIKLLHSQSNSVASQEEADIAKSPLLRRALQMLDGGGVISELKSLIISGGEQQIKLKLDQNAKVEGLKVLGGATLVLNGDGSPKRNLEISDLSAEPNSIVVFSLKGAVLNRCEILGPVGGTISESMLHSCSMRGGTFDPSGLSGSHPIITQKCELYNCGWSRTLSLFGKIKGFKRVLS